MPGPWKTSFVPYAKEPMDAFTDPEIEHIILCFGSQASKTEIILNMIGYAADKDPGPMLVVYPEDDTAEFASENRIEPMVLSVPSLKNKYDQRNSEKLELKFDDIFIALNGANSPSKLASKPIRYLFRDEINKYKQWVGKEASPLDLSEERTKTFPHNRKIVDASTPVLKTGNIWVALENADALKKYYVPCPHCGVKQILSFKQIKWPKEINNDAKLARDVAWYECEHCKSVIEDRHKQQMLLLGEWRQVNQSVGRIRSVAYHINSIYSPFVSFGDMAHKFLISKNYPEKLMNFINSWLAEPWEDKAATLDRDVVLEKQASEQESVVPEWAQLLTGGVDVQKGYMYWSIDAWGARLTSQNIAHGWVETWEDLEKIMNRYWPDVNGELRCQVNLCAIDSGYDTENVYDFCLQNQDWAVPVKGSSTPMISRYRRSKIDNPNSKAFGQTLYIVDPDQYKNLIAARINRPVGMGCFMVFAGCDAEYAEQLTAEHKIRERKGNREIETWVPKSSSAANHYLDCKVYSSLAADLLQVRYLDDLTETAAATQPANNDKDVNSEEWLKVKEDDWL